MKVRKLIAGLAAIAIVGSALTGAAYAAKFDSISAITLDPNDADGKMAQWDISLFGSDPIETIVVKGKVNGDEFQGGGGVGFDSASEWVQVDFSSGSDNVVIDDDGNYTATLDFTTVKDNVPAEEGILQLGWWWGGGDGKFELTSLEVNGKEMIGAEAEADEAEKTEGQFTAEFAAQFDAAVTEEWPSFADQTVKFNYGEETTISIDMGDVVKFGGNYIAVNTDVPFVEGIEANITSFKLDGEEIEMGDAYLNSEGTNGGLRLTIANLWNSDIKEQPVDPAGLPEFQTIDVTFVVNGSDEAEEEAPAEEEAASPNWDEYDAAAAKAQNEAFVYGEPGKIDLYAAVGDKWADLAKIEATFAWDGATDWNGGAGIGNGAVFEDGSGWYSGAEFGTVNANQGIVAEGKHTYTILDLSSNKLTQIAGVDAKSGKTTFAALEVQGWWNFKEAGAKLLKLDFLDADGNSIGAIEYAAPVEEAPAQVDAEKSTNDNPKTGVADLAGAATVAVLAAGTMFFSRKRK